MKTPRTLLYDIETSYLVIGAWDIYETNALVVLQDWQILCFAYKWLGDKRVKVLGQDDTPGYKPGKLNDKALVEELWQLFDEADVVVAHNGNSFDQKKAQARMMVHGLKPPSPYMQVDTKGEMKKVAAHTSNKLDDLNRSLGLETKLGHEGIATWTGCMNGDPRAWKVMKRYNQQDIVALEQLYLYERPWIRNHPKLNVLAGRPAACPKCLSENIRSGMRYRATSQNLYQYFRCNDCGGTMKATIPEPKAKGERVLYA